MSEARVSTVANDNVVDSLSHKVRHEGNLKCMLRFLSLCIASCVNVNHPFILKDVFQRFRYVSLIVSGLTSV